MTDTEADLRDRLAKAEAEVTRLRGELEAAKAEVVELRGDPCEHCDSTFGHVFDNNHDKGTPPCTWYCANCWWEFGKTLDAQRRRADAAEKALAVEVAAHGATHAREREALRTKEAVGQDLHLTTLRADAATQQAEALAAQLAETRAWIQREIDSPHSATGIVTGKHQEGFCRTCATRYEEAQAVLSTPDSSAEVLKRRDARVYRACASIAETLVGSKSIVSETLRSLASSIEAEGKGTKPGGTT